MASRFAYLCFFCSEGAEELQVALNKHTKDDWALATITHVPDRVDGEGVAHGSLLVTMVRLLPDVIKG